MMRRGSDQRLGKLVPLRPGDTVLGLRRAQLVCLVEHHQIVGRDARIAERPEHALGHQSVQRHDDSVACCSDEGVCAISAIGSGDDAALQPEQGAKLPLPVAHEPGRRDDQHPPNTTPEQHLAHAESGHDGLAGAGVVGEQEAQRLLRQHPLVDRNSLMWKRIDPCGLARECRVELVPVRQAVSFRDQQHRGRVSGEIQRDMGCGKWARPLRMIGGCPVRRRLFQRLQPLERKGARTGLTRLPAMHREWCHRHPLGELSLGHIQARAGVLHTFGEAGKWLVTVHGADFTAQCNPGSMFSFKIRIVDYQMIDL